MTNYKLQIEYKKINQSANTGAATLILVFFFMFISLTILTGIVTPVVREFKIASNTLASRQSYFMSESGVEDAVYRIKNNKTIGSSETLTLGTSFTTTAITVSPSGNQKSIVSLGDTNTYQRTTSISLTTTPGASFGYGAQIGDGGMYLVGGSIKGDVYSNGSIHANNFSINGDVFVANTATSISNEGTNPTTVSLHTMPSGEDFAQSFIPYTSGSLKRVSLYIKKSAADTTSDLFVRIMNDNNGVPGSTQLASFNYSANYNYNNIPTTFSWQNADFPSPPNVVAGTKYWIVIDGLSWWGGYDYAAEAGLPAGSGLKGTYNASWGATSPANLSGYFRVYVNDLANNFPSYINATSSLNVSGDVHTNSATKVSATGTIYCQTGVSNNKSCTTTPTSSSNPPPMDFAIPQTSIDTWKAQATAGGHTTTINTNGSMSIGPKEIDGDLILTGSADITITGPVYVTGKIDISGSAKIELASSYGANDGVIISDGTINVTGSGSVLGSGNNNSYMVLITMSNKIHTTANNPPSSEFAGHFGSSGHLDTLFAPNGDVLLDGSSEIRAASAYEMMINGSGEIEFNSALTNMTFPSSSSSGGWGIASWKETQ